jgi:putative hemolysin
MLLLSVYILVFLSLSGLLALLDAAVLSVTLAETEEMILHHKPGALWLRTVKQNITQAVVVIVMVTNTINILGPILIGQKAVAVYGSAVIGVITAVLTFGTIIFSEIIPKSLGTHYAPSVSRFAAPVIVWLSWGLYPVVVLLERIAAFFQRGERHIGTEAQIRSLVTIGLRSGQIEEDEGQMIHQAFVLNDRSAEDIMTPLVLIVSIPATATIREAAEVVFDNELSRYPVFGETPNDVMGMVRSRDILSTLATGKDTEPITKLLYPTPRVRADKRSDGLLAMFRSRQTHLATVHKGGKTIGLVTLEDVLEELVGEIDDEKDEPTWFESDASS